MMVQVYTITSVSSEQTLVFTRNQSVVSFIRKSVPKKVKGGNVEISNAQILTNKLFAKDEVIYFDNEHYRMMNYDKGMSGLYKVYLEEGPDYGRS